MNFFRGVLWGIIFVFPIWCVIGCASYHIYKMRSPIERNEKKIFDTGKEMVEIEQKGHDVVFKVRK